MQTTCALLNDEDFDASILQLLGAVHLSQLHARDKLALLFDHYDADRSGELSIDEVRSFIVDLTGTATGSDSVLQELDVDGSGVVSKTEFVAVLEGLLSG